VPERFSRSEVLLASRCSTLCLGARPSGSLRRRPELKGKRPRPGTPATNRPATRTPPPRRGFGAGRGPGTWATDPGRGRAAEAGAGEFMDRRRTRSPSGPAAAGRISARCRSLVRQFVLASCGHARRFERDGAKNLWVETKDPRLRAKHGTSVRRCTRVARTAEYRSARGARLQGWAKGTVIEGRS